MRDEPDLPDLAAPDLNDVDLPQVHADELFNVAAPPTRADAGFDPLMSLRDANHAFGTTTVTAHDDERLSHGWWDAARWPEREHAFSI